MKAILKSVALAAACALAAGALSSCNQDTSWTYRTDDGAYEVTSGMYIGMSISAYNEGMSQEGMDTSAPLYGQQIESKDALDWVISRTESIAKKYLAVESKFDAYSLAFTEEEQSNIDSYVDYYWSYLSGSYEPQGCSENSYRKLMTNSFKESQLFFAIYGEGGERAVSDDDLRAIFDEQYAHINVFQVDASDEEGEPLTGNELEIKQKEVDGILEDLENGTDFESVKAEYDSSDKDSASEEEKSGEEVKETDTSFYITTSSSYPEDLVTALFDASAGEFGSFNDEEGTFYIWTKLDNDDAGFDTYRDTILQNEKWEEFTQYEQDWVNGMTFVTNDASLKKHSPKNLE